MNNGPDTIQILDAVRAELQRAQEDYERQPDFEKLQQINFLQRKVDQYSARAEKRQSRARNLSGFQTFMIPDSPIKKYMSCADPMKHQSKHCIGTRNFLTARSSAYQKGATTTPLKNWKRKALSVFM